MLVNETKTVAFKGREFLRSKNAKL